MTKINLREQYPDFYKTDYIIEVPDEVAAVMKEHDRLEPHTAAVHITTRRIILWIAETELSMMPFSFP